MFGFLKSRKEEILPERESDGSTLRAVLPRPVRESSYKEAVLTTNTGIKYRGIVIDHSQTGVRIRFQSIEPLPDLVHLNISGLHYKGSARVVWRDTVDFGLEFVTE